MRSAQVLIKRMQITYLWDSVRGKFGGLDSAVYSNLPLHSLRQLPSPSVYTTSIDVQIFILRSSLYCTYNMITLIFHKIQGFVTMLSLDGPTPIHLIGTFKKLSMNSTYFLQLSGNALYDVTCSIEEFHPGSVTYSTSTFSRMSKSAKV